MAKKSINKYPNKTLKGKLVRGADGEALLDKDGNPVYLPDAGIAKLTLSPIDAALLGVTSVGPQALRWVGANIAGNAMANSVSQLPEGAVSIAGNIPKIPISEDLKRIGGFNDFKQAKQYFKDGKIGKGAYNIATGIAGVYDSDWIPGRYDDVVDKALEYTNVVGDSYDAIKGLKELKANGGYLKSYATGGEMKKSTNSQFLPTYINGVPMYMCGGKMKYADGGFVNYLKNNKDDIASAASTSSGMFGSGVGGKTASGALSGLSAGAMFGPIGMGVGALVGGAAGLIGGLGEQKQQQQMMQQQQQEAIKQQLISNLPAQSNYVPTFADGGDINNNSFVTNWLSNRKDILKSNLGETSLKNYVSSNPNAINDRLNLYQNKISSTSESINPNLPSNVNGVTYTKGNQSRIEYPSVPLPQTRTHEQVHAAGITPDVSNTIKRITGLDYNKPLIDVQTPNELYPRLMEMRQVNQLDPTKQYSPEDVVKFRQVNTSGKKNALFDYFDDATISKLLNEVAMNNTDNTVNFAANGGELPITDRIANIDNGQTHEQSAIGGVPMGQNALTEVGEVVFKNKAGKKYVFTNRF